MKGEGGVKKEEGGKKKKHQKNSPRTHPSMDLVFKGLDIMLHSQVFLKGFHCIGVLVLGSEQAKGNCNILGVVGIDHGGMDLSCGGKGSAFSCR